MVKNKCEPHVGGINMMCAVSEINIFLNNLCCFRIRRFMKGSRTE